MTGWIKVSSKILDNEFVQKKLITSSYSKSSNSPGLNQILKEIDEMIWEIIFPKTVFRIIPFCRNKYFVYCREDLFPKKMFKDLDF